MPAAQRRRGRARPAASRCSRSSHLREVIGALRGESGLARRRPLRPARRPSRTAARAERRGRPAEGRHALEVAAAGAHHLLLQGPPGAGKTLLAERLPSILPPLIEQHALEVTAVHSVAGLLPPGRPLVTRAPFQAPHHSASAAALVGWRRRASPARARCPWPIAACSSSTRRPNSPRTPSSRCGSRWSPGDRRARPLPDLGHLPRPLPARARGQPVPLRSGARPLGGLPVHPDAGTPLRGAAVRTAAGPDRPPGRGLRRPSGHPARRRLGRDLGGGGRAGPGGA